MSSVEVDSLIGYGAAAAVVALVLLPGWKRRAQDQLRLRRLRRRFAGQRVRRRPF
jgi:hypothetical protein